MKLSKLKVGVAMRDICPPKPMFLIGYPHLERTSTGVHDPIFASAFCLTNSRQSLITISADVCYLMAETSKTCREAISEKTGIPIQNILISTTHTHSAPQ